MRFARLSRFNGNIRIFLNLESRVSIISPPPLSLCTYTYRCDHFTSIFSLRLNVFLVHLRNYRAFRLRVASMNFFRNENFSLSFFFIFEPLNLQTAR